MKTVLLWFSIVVVMCGQDVPPSPSPFSVSEERARRNAAKRAKEGILDPVLIKDVPIALPASLKIPAAGGKVEVSLYIKSDGSVGSAEITSSTHPMFNEPVMNAVKQRRYAPAKKNGKPVEFILSAMVIIPPPRTPSASAAPKD
jgi:TonB family protein